MIITEEMLAALREDIKPYLTGKRYAHTLAVEKAAAELGGIYLPDQVTKLRAAALLHDITKMADTEKQLQYCREFDIMVTASDRQSPKIFHAKTGAELAKRAFAAYADPVVIDGIRWHTTGHDGMTVLKPSCIWLIILKKPVHSRTALRSESISAGNLQKRTARRKGKRC